MHRRSAGRRAAAALLASIAAAASVLAVSPPAAAAVPDEWAASPATAGNTGTNLGERTITTRTAPRLQQAWERNEFLGPRAPVIRKGVALVVQDARDAARQSELVALDVRTGRRLWRVGLGGPGRSYYGGSAFAGDVLVVPYSGWQEAGGLTAVNLRTRKVLWSRSHPRSPLVDPKQTDTSGGVVAIDRGRVHLRTDTALLAAFNLRTGRLLWQQGLRGTGAYGGMAVSGGRVYVAAVDRYQGPTYLAVLDAASGRRLWTAPRIEGTPVLAGTMVVASTATGVAAVKAAGCGRSTCRLAWSRDIPELEQLETAVGGATATSVFVGVTIHDDSGYSGRLLRLDPRTGRLQWSVDRPEPFATAPIRAGNTVWLNEYGTKIHGWSVTATRSRPLVTIPLANTNFSGSLAAAGGTLLVQKWADTLTAYRVRGT